MKKLLESLLSLFQAAGTSVAVGTAAVALILGVSMLAMWVLKHAVQLLSSATGLPTGLSMVLILFCALASVIVANVRYA